MYLKEDTTHLRFFDKDLNLKAGTVVYYHKGADYGCSSEDTVCYGEEYVTVTLHKKGFGVFFTVPKRILGEEPEC